MKDEVWIIITTLLCNVMMVFIFGKLALVFDKWWIILFAVFFIKDIKYRSKETQEEKPDGA